MGFVKAVGADSSASSGDESLRELLQARYRQEQAPGEIRANAVLETILSHRTVRAYLQRQLAVGALETIVAAAQSAPSSSNLQAWSVVAVEDRARRERLSVFAGAQSHIVEAPLFLVWLADLSRLRVIADAEGRTANGLDYLESFLVAVVDAALAAQNAVVAAESLGLGSCYIGAIRNRPEEVAAELDLPPETIAVFGLTLGYPDPERPADVKPRLSQPVVLHRERYDRAQPAEEALDRYNRALRDFQAEQKLAPADWTDQASARIATTEALKGRHLLNETLRTLGFALK